MTFDLQEMERSVISMDSFRPMRRPTHRSNSYEVLDIEFELPIECSSPHKICNFPVQPIEISLLKYNDIPAFLKGNPYVQSGYRVYLSGTTCLRSLFIWSNETVNIWSHLIGFLFFFILMFVDNLYMIPLYSGSMIDHFVVTLGLICYQFCMLCSSGYHIFACHSERACLRWLSLDLAGISVGFIGCYIPAVHFAFYCLSIWRDFYLFTATCLSFAVLVVQLYPRFATNRYWRLRIFVFCCLAGFGVFPTLHWIVLSGGLSSELVQLFLHKVVVMYIFGSLALFLYLTKFPERLFPGRLDYIGSSHQLWHVLVLVSFIWWHQAGGELLEYRNSHMCFPY